MLQERQETDLDIEQLTASECAVAVQRTQEEMPLYGATPEQVEAMVRQVYANFGIDLNARLDALLIL